MCRSRVLPLPVAIQNASLVRSAAVKDGNGVRLRDVTCGAERRQPAVEIGQERVPVQEEPVQHVLGVEKRQVLEVLEDDPLVGGPRRVDTIQVALDVIVVRLDVRLRQATVQAQQPLRHAGATVRVVAVGDIVQQLLELAEVARAQQRVQVAVQQGQAVFEAGPGFGHQADPRWIFPALCQAQRACTMAAWSFCCSRSRGGSLGQDIRRR